MKKPITHKILLVKIVLRDIKPLIWRKVLVPGRYTLAKMHHVIQETMGWTDSHLHAFHFQGEEFGPMDVEEMDWRDEKSVTLGKLLTRPRMKLSYLYDFGDDWNHDIVLEKIFEEECLDEYPLCVGGERACPLEDCGCFVGHLEICRLLKNPKLPDPENIRRWVGKDYDPEAFDEEAVNQKLKSLWRKR